MPAKNKAQVKNIVVFANGSPPAKALVAPYIDDSTIIMCADGGANTAIDIGIKPDYVVGDFDSLDVNIVSANEGIILHHTLDQDKTDLEKTLTFAETFKPDTVVIFGATGNRIDHALGNLALLFAFGEKFKLSMIDDKCIVKPIFDEIVLKGKPGQTVSLFSFSSHCEGVYTTGLKFPLENARVPSGTLGISNQFVGKDARIKISKGRLLAIINHA